MIRFYAPDLLTEPVLPAADSAHAVRVLRMRVGDELHAVDGRGHSMLCRLTDANQHKARVEIVEVREEPQTWPQQIVVAVAPTKNMDRMEWLTEKLVEVGVNRIVPVLCRNSERRDIKRERLEKIAVSAMKQSLKAILPLIDEMTPLKNFLSDLSGDYMRVMGYCDAAYPRCEFARLYRPPRNVSILIGPEGDFDPSEVEAAVAAGFIPVTFGPQRLRTETAALVSAVAVHTLTQSM